MTGVRSKNLDSVFFKKDKNQKCEDRIQASAKKKKRYDGVVEPSVSPTSLPIHGPDFSLRVLFHRRIRAEAVEHPREASGRRGGGETEIIFRYRWMS